MGSNLPGPTRPDRLTIWPVDEHGFGIDVRWGGPAGHDRANAVHRLCRDAGIKTRLSDDGGYGWIVRAGPIPGSEVARVIDEFVW